MAFRAVGLRDYFVTVVTASDTDAHKPSPAPIRLALERLDAAADGAVYVGDAPVDIAAGQAAGVATVAVTWGIFPVDALLAAEPDFVVATPAALADLCLSGAEVLARHDRSAATGGARPGADHRGEAAR